jgi:phage baseplate assembly protein W
MTGMNRETGRTLVGWAHVQQSLAVLFSTPKARRVMRRHVGSDNARQVDMPVSSVTLIDLYAGATAAVAAFEPRFRITRLRASEMTPDGHLTVDAEGVYYPRGHLGDYSIAEPKAASIPV